jgi:hypothetical protein
MDVKPAEADGEVALRGRIERLAFKEEHVPFGHCRPEICYDQVR